MLSHLGQRLRYRPSLVISTVRINRKYTIMPMASEITTPFRFVQEK